MSVSFTIDSNSFQIEPNAQDGAYQVLWSYKVLEPNGAEFKVKLPIFGRTKHLDYYLPQMRAGAFAAAELCEKEAHGITLTADELNRLRHCTRPISRVCIKQPTVPPAPAAPTITPAFIASTLITLQTQISSLNERIAQLESQLQQVTADRVTLTAELATTRNQLAAVLETLRILTS